MVLAPSHLIPLARNVKFVIHFSFVETGNEYRAVLSDIIHPERTLLTQVAPVNATSCTLTFVFPPSDTISAPLEHITMPQINEAIFEGLFIITAHVIRTRALNLLLSYDDFLLHRLHAVIREEQLKFRQMLTPLAPACLTMSLLGSEIRKRFAAITIGIEGFVEGKVMFLIPLTLVSPDASLPPLSKSP